jgi:NAD(P)-dependent dehydrogenase (short-subunit alcohol dehydrogenase family)
MQLFDLSGKIAIITGASRGIGRAIAERMAEHGAAVVVSSRRLPACEEVVDGIRERGGKALAVACNVGKKAELSQLVAAALAEFGGVDILVGSAGINFYVGPSTSMPDEVYDKIMDVNVKANLRLSALVVPSMIERGGGAILLISSIGGIVGSGSIGAYCISKAAEMQLVRNLAVEFGPHKIRANCIAPGLIETEFSRALWENPDYYKHAVLEAPLQRIGQPDDVAAAAVFLASDGGSFVTGQSILVDGGRSIGRVLSQSGN